MFIVEGNKMQQLRIIMKQMKGKGAETTKEDVRKRKDMAVRSIIEIAIIVYNAGQITEQMCKSVFITIPKVSGTLDCDNHN